MVHFSATQHIAAPREAVWNHLTTIGTWWLPSIPEHDSLEIASTAEGLRSGMRIRLRERLRNIPAEAEGVIREVSPNRSITWEVVSTCRLFGRKVPVREGVTWNVRRGPGGTELEVYVWRDFSQTWRGRLFELFSRNTRQSERTDYARVTGELDTIKELLESRHGAETPA